MANAKYKATIDERIAEQKARAVEYYREIPIFKHAAAFAGVHEDTLHLWKKADQQFSDDLQKAKAEFVRKHGKKAKSEFLLERLDKPNFKETKEVELTTPQPILGGISVQRDARNEEDSQTPQEN